MTLSELAQHLLRDACPTAVHRDGSHTVTIDTHCVSYEVTFKTGEYGVYEILSAKILDSPNQT